MPPSNKMLKIIGRKSILSVVQIVLLAVLYGTQLVLITIFMTLQRKWTPTKSTARITLVMALIFMLIFSAVPVVIFAIFITSEGMIIAGDLEVDETGFDVLWDRYRTIVTSIVYINVRPTHARPGSEHWSATKSLLGDFVMYWRVAALWKSKRALFLPMLMLSCTAASDIALIGCYLANGNDRFGKCSPVRIVGYVLTVCTNLTTITLLWYYTWLHKKAVREYLNAGSYSAHPERVLVIMVESGVLYTVILLLSGTFTSITEAAHSVSLRISCAQGVIEALVLGLVGVYPISLVVVIFLQKSLWDPNGDVVQERPSQQL